MSIERPRRYYLLKRLESARQGDTALSSVWHAKQIEEPGVALAADFPYRTRLETAGYLTTEDLDGATVEELQLAGFTKTEATAVLAAI